MTGNDTLLELVRKARDKGEWGSGSPSDDGK